jgi:hypothetical protein
MLQKLVNLFEAENGKTHSKQRTDVTSLHSSYIGRKVGQAAYDKVQVGRGDFVNTTMKLHIPQEAATFLMS